MRTRTGAAAPLVIAALVVGAGVVSVTVTPRAARSVVMGKAIVITDEIVTPDQGPTMRATSPAARDDAENVAALIAAVRNANPILCELASRGAMWSGNWQYVGPATPLRVRGSGDMELVRFAASSPKGREVIAPLRAALGDPDPCVRRFVAPLLGRTQQSAAVETLVTALRDENPVTRESAAIGLRFAENPSTIDPLTRALEDRESSVRAAAAWALGEIEDSRAIPALERTLKDADPLVRINAAWALGEIEDPAAIPALTALLREDRDPEVRRMAAWALGNIE
ncbi:MAG TPA: HEAT repeat domain-containing protein [Gemmatimonadaceae bacterium]|nr:HEAT repeat domain-containing protein [Gemmatimonadaceae bacterium]